MNADQIATYCECAFVEIVEYFGGEVSKTGNFYSLTDAAVAADSGRDCGLQGTRVCLQDTLEDIPADIRGCSPARAAALTRHSRLIRPTTQV